MTVTSIFPSCSTEEDNKKLFFWLRNTRKQRPEVLEVLLIFYPYDRRDTPNSSGYVEVPRNNALDDVREEDRQFLCVGFRRSVVERVVHIPFPNLKLQSRRHEAQILQHCTFGDTQLELLRDTSKRLREVAATNHKLKFRVQNCVEVADFFALDNELVG